MVTRSRNDAIALDEIIALAEFRAALRAFMRHSELTARKWGLTPQRFQLLLAIKGAPDGSERLSVSAIADRLQVSQNTVTELCARAEELSLIQREPSKRDRRVTYLQLTPDGDRALHSVLVDNQAFRRELDEAFGSLTRSFRTADHGA